jgi:ligand-binding SRPBCC domain-containing protein
MRRRAEFAIGSTLRAQPAAVWERAMSAEGINAELAPLLRMTVPRGLDSLDLHGLEPGRGFLERSTMLSQRLWEHERTIEPAGAGAATIVDRLAWEPRLPLPGALLRPLIAALFRHRHQRLRRHFGGAPLPRR